MCNVHDCDTKPKENMGMKSMTFFAQIHENDQKIFPLQFNFSQANFFNQQKICSNY